MMEGSDLKHKVILLAVENRSLSLYFIIKLETEKLYKRQNYDQTFKDENYKENKKYRQ